LGRKKDGGYQDIWLVTEKPPVSNSEPNSGQDSLRVNA